MRDHSASYHDIGEARSDQRGATPWYWHLAAIASTWMILGGYLLLPGLYARDAQLRFGQPALTVCVVALLTAGYSFTALLCLACRNALFRAEAVFLPALSSSAIGLISIAYNFCSSRAYVWGAPAISGTVVGTIATLVYGVLLLWTHHRIVRARQAAPRQLWSSASYYSNFVQNMYPTATHTPTAAVPFEPAISEDDRVNQQMALLLIKSDQRPSPDANSATFRIDLPEDLEQQERIAHSQELIGTPGPTHADWGRTRADSRPDSLSELQAWELWQGRGRTTSRPSSIGQRSAHSRTLSREERRREIELGRP